MSVLSNLSTFLDEAIHRYGVPGASLAVLAKGSTHVAASGVINTETQVETTVDTVFQIGSITKLVTAVMVMQLFEEGKLNIDAPIRSILPEFSVADGDVSKNVTPRHLLSHSSGIDGDFFVDTGRGEDKVAKLVELGRSLPQLHPLGGGFSYCNFGFAVLGRVIELIDGVDWDTSVHQRIAKKLKTNYLTTQPEFLLRSRAAIGHLPTKSAGQLAPARQPYLSFGMGPAGSTLTCRAQDLINFAQTFLDQGGSLLSPNSIEMMRTENTRVVNSNSVQGFGLGFMLFDWNGAKLFGHDGGTVGQSSFLRIYDDEIAVALLTNGGDTQGLAHEVMTVLFTELVGIAPPTSPEGATKSIDSTRYVGTYQRGMTRFDIEFNGNDLILRSGPSDEWSVGLVPQSGPFVLMSVDEETFTYRIPGMSLLTTVQFVDANESGIFTALHMGMRRNPRIS